MTDRNLFKFNKIKVTPAMRVSELEEIRDQAGMPEDELLDMFLTVAKYSGDPGTVEKNLGLALGKVQRFLMNPPLERPVEFDRYDPKTCIMLGFLDGTNQPLSLNFKRSPNGHAAVIGPSGFGKSFTMLNMIRGYFPTKVRKVPRAYRMSMTVSQTEVYATP